MTQTRSKTGLPLHSQKASTWTPVSLPPLVLAPPPGPVLCVSKVSFLGKVDHPTPNDTIPSESRCKSGVHTPHLASAALHDP